jgi:hypothetical protein
MKTPGIVQDAPCMENEPLHLHACKCSGEYVTCHGCMERSGILPLSWISPVNAFFKIARGRVCNLTAGRVFSSRD